MTDADRFLQEALAQSACLPVAAEHLEFKDITYGVFVSIVWRCLGKIQEAEPHLAFQIPDDVDAQGGVAAKHRVGSQLANILKELGYAGDCGYSHFLYPNEKESRSILSWLVGKLPGVDGFKTSSEVASTEASATATTSTIDYLADQPLADIFSSWMKRKTLYLFPNRDVPGLHGFEKLPLRTVRVSLPWSEGDADSLRSAFQSSSPGISRAASLLEAIVVVQRKQALNIDDLDDVDDAIASTSAFGGRIMDGNTDDVVNSSPTGVSAEDKADTGAEFSSIDTFAMPPFFVSAAGAIKENAMAQLQMADIDGKTEGNAGVAESNENEPHKLSALHDNAGQAALEHIHVRLMETQQRIEQLREEVDQDEDQLIAIQSRIEVAKSQGLVLKKEVAMKRQLLGLLPQAEENIVKLEAICAKNELKLDELVSEWESHKRPLEAEEQTLLSMKSNRKARCRQYVTEMKKFRTEMKDMAATIQEKMETLRLLDKTYASLPQHINRNSYTNRIMDIIKQVHKQKQEIGRIIEDIKAIQKQLNFSSEKLKRSEAVTEEKLFGEASKQVNGSKDSNNPYVECYRKFAQVRELFEELILVVGDVGKKENATRDLENWITQLHGRDSSEQLDRVLADLQSVRLENAVINEQIRTLRGKQ